VFFFLLWWGMALLPPSGHFSTIFRLSRCLFIHLFKLQFRFDFLSRVGFFDVPPFFSEVRFFLIHPLPPPPGSSLGAYALPAQRHFDIFSLSCVRFSLFYFRQAPFTDRYREFKFLRHTFIPLPLLFRPVLSFLPDPNGNPSSSRAQRFYLRSPQKTVFQFPISPL